MDISYTPLTPAVFYILLVVSHGDKHGYQIMKQVLEVTNGAVRLGNGTLYGSIKRMITTGLLQEVTTSEEPTTEREVRRYYRITPAGQQHLNAELERYQQTLTYAMRQDTLGKA